MEFASLRGSLGGLHASQENALSRWHAAMREGLVALQQPFDSLRRDTEEVAEEFKQANLAFEEERSKSLMLEDQVSSLSLEVSQLRLSKQESERNAFARIETLEVERSTHVIVSIYLSIYTKRNALTNERPHERTNELTHSLSVCILD